MKNIKISIPYPPFTENPLNVSEIPISYIQEEDIIKLEIPSQFYWMAQLMGLKITYIQD